MKSAVILLIVIMLIMCVSFGCASPHLAAGPGLSPPAVTAGDDSAKFKDGTYGFIGEMDPEGYYVKGSLKVLGGKVASLDWAILDSNRDDKVFDKDYESVFTGNETYMQQCRDNLKGMEEYDRGIIGRLSADEVDAVSGATWAYHKFKEFVNGVLMQASMD